MIREFKEMDERLQKHKPEFPLTAWKQDKADTKELLTFGRERGEEIIESLLLPSSYLTPKNDKHATVDARLELFGEANQALGGKTWGVTATEQAAQLTSIVRKLFLEDAGH